MDYFCAREVFPPRPPAPFPPHPFPFPPSLPPSLLSVSGTGAILRAAGFVESADTWDLRPSEHGWNLLCSVKAELDSSIATLPPSLPLPASGAGARGLAMPPMMGGGGGGIGGGMGGGAGNLDFAMLQQAMQNPVSGREGGREGRRRRRRVCLSLVALSYERLLLRFSFPSLKFLSPSPSPPCFSLSLQPRVKVKMTD